MANRSLSKVSDAAVVARNCLGSGVDAGDADAESQVDAVLLVPIETIQDDVVAGFFARQTPTTAECGCS